jgi:molybdopterin synthase sulfur carrier subunit
MSKIATVTGCASDRIWKDEIVLTGRRPDPSHPMTITIHVPAALRACCKGAAKLSLSAPNVQAALEQIERSHPALYRSICDETGSVRRHVNLFVNTSHMRDREGLETALVPGDVITILPAVSGG